MTRLSNIKTFSLKALKRHNNFYNYSKFIYISQFIEGEIICPIHGSFYQKPKKHLQGHGCWQCVIDKKRSPWSKVLLKAKETHFDDDYDYSQYIYINNQTPGNIICKLHGIFSQNMANHIYSKQGCPVCASLRHKIRCKTNKENIPHDIVFKNRCLEIYNNFYDYSKFVYVNSQTPGIIICPIHGEFKKSPNNHIFDKQGCRLCSRKRYFY